MLIQHDLADLLERMLRIEALYGCLVVIPGFRHGGGGGGGKGSVRVRGAMEVLAKRIERRH